MSDTVATLRMMIIADAAKVAPGIILAKDELRGLSKVLRETKSAADQFSESRAQMARFVASGHLSADAAATKLAALHQKLFPKTLPKAVEIFDAELAPTMVEKSLSALATTGKAFGFAMTPARAALAAFGTTSAVVGGTVAGLGAIIHGRIRDIDALGDAAQRLGVGIGELSILKTAAFLGDIDHSGLDGMIQKMLVHIGDSSEAISKLGLDSSKLKQQGTAQSFADISKAIAGLPSKAEQFAAIAEVFGKTGPEAAELVLRFNDLRQAALDSGAVVGDKLGAKVSEVDEAMKRAILSAEGWANALTDATAPAIATVITALTDLAQSREQGRELGGNLGGLFGGMSGRFLGGRLMDAMHDQLDAVKEDARMSQIVKASHEALTRSMMVEAEAWKRIAAAEEDAERQDHQHAESIRKMIEAVQDETKMLEMNAEQKSAFRVMRAGGLPAEQEQAAAAQKVLEARRAELDFTKEISRLRVQDAIRSIDEAEKIKESLKTENDLVAERAARIGQLHAGGLLTDAERDKALRLEASRMADRVGFGAPSASKGTAAARELVLMAGKEAEQVKLLTQIEARLRELADKEAVVIEEVHE